MPVANSQVQRMRVIEDLTATWSYAPPAAGLVNSTTAVTIKAAVAGKKNCITHIGVSTETMATATELVIRKGAGGTVLWRTKLNTALQRFDEAFDTPLQSDVNQLLEICLLTLSATGAVYVNAQGFEAS